jgi:hypothetical protein
VTELGISSECEIFCLPEKFCEMKESMGTCCGFRNVLNVKVKTSGLRYAMAFLIRIEEGDVMQANNRVKPDGSPPFFGMVMLSLWGKFREFIQLRPYEHLSW